MSLFKDMLSNNESLFTNETALDIDYIPPIIKYRENQQDYIAICIKPLFQNRNGKNLLITGSPGIGKTIAVRHIFSELVKETEEITPIYINCWKKDTAYKIVLDICEQLNYKFVLNKKMDELFRDILKILNKKRVVFCFDEIDKLKEFQILYSLLEDIYKKSIFLITNEKEWLATLDVRIKSRLLLENLEFRPYNHEETRGILEQRKDFAFVKNVWDSEALESIVNKTAELRDIRTGLFLLREAGNAAESDSSKKIELKHAENAISKLKDFKVKDSKNLEESDKVLLDLIKIHSGKTSKEVYRLYGKDISYRTFLKKINNLVQNKMMHMEDGVSKQGGKVKILKYGSLKKLEEFS